MCVQVHTCPGDNEFLPKEHECSEVAAQCRAPTCPTPARRATTFPSRRVLDTPPHTPAHRPLLR